MPTTQAAYIYCHRTNPHSTPFHFAFLELSTNAALAAPAANRPAFFLCHTWLLPLLVLSYVTLALPPCRVCRPPLIAIITIYFSAKHLHVYFEMGSANAIAIFCIELRFTPALLSQFHKPCGIYSFVPQLTSTFQLPPSLPGEAIASFPLGGAY